MFHTTYTTWKIGAFYQVAFIDFYFPFDNFKACFDLQVEKKICFR